MAKRKKTVKSEVKEMDKEIDPFERACMEAASTAISRMQSTPTCNTSTMRKYIADSIRHVFQTSGLLKE